jgi:WD40 repeat protein
MVTAEDTRQLFVGSRNGSILQIDLDAPEQEPAVIGQQSGSGPEAVALSPDHRLLYSLGFDTLDAWDIERQQLAWSRSDLNGNCLAIGDGDTLLCGSRSGTIWELDLHTGETREAVQQAGMTIWHLAVSSDNRRLLAVDASGQGRLFDRCTCDGRWLARPSGDIFTGNRRMSFSASGLELIGVSVDAHSLILWDVEEQQPICQLRGHAGAVLGAAFRTDGTLISWGTDGTIRVWDLTTQLVKQVITLKNSRIAG